MLRFCLFFLFLNLSLALLAQERKDIEECTIIKDDILRLNCFDSFFQNDQSMILVNKEDVLLFEEKSIPEKEISIKEKVIVKAERSIIDSNLVLIAVKLAGRDFIFELNDKSRWRSIESVRKKDIPTPGDKVELKPGILGSMFLKIKGKKNKIRIKKIKS
tara:strand:+ start:695 stop:1174 length:480 start_codon:yes stop_codon:yes gene_type:complete